MKQGKSREAKEKTPKSVFLLKFMVLSINACPFYQKVLVKCLPNEATKPIHSYMNSGNLQGEGQPLTEAQFSPFFVVTTTAAISQTKWGTKKLDNLSKEAASKWQARAVLCSGDFILVQCLRTKIKKKKKKVNRKAVFRQDRAH